MWINIINKDSLVVALRGVITGNQNENIKKQASFKVLPNLKDNLALIWMHDPAEEEFLPSFIVTENGGKRELLAWLSTYMPSLRPITHLIRIMERHHYDQMINYKNQMSYRKCLNAIVGSVVAEAKSRTLHKSANAKITYRDCLETCSYVAGKSLFLGVNEDSHQDIFERWMRAQKYSRRLHSVLSVAQTVKVQNYFIKKLCNSDSSMHEMSAYSEVNDLIAEMFLKGTASTASLKSIANKLDLSYDLLLKTAEGTRESRVTALEEALSSLADVKKKYAEIVPIVAAYIVNQASPGTLEYLPLLAKASGHDSATTIWYGFLSGLHPKSLALDYEDGLGWTIAIQITRLLNLDERPNADIDLDEFEMLSSSEKKFSNHKMYRPGSVTVEILPGINTIVAIPEAVTVTVTKDAQQQLFANDLLEEDVSSIMEDVDDAVHQLRVIRNRLGRINVSSKKKSTADNRVSGYRKSRKKK